MMGGFDFVIVSSEPPLLETVKLPDWLWPGAASKKSASGTITIAGGSPAEPDVKTVTVPPVLPTVNEPVYMPFAVGANVRPIVAVAPGASVWPTAGAVVKANGVAGGISDVRLSVCVPTFVSTTFADTDLPRAMPPKLTDVGDTCSVGPAGCPAPCSGTTPSPTDVAMFSEAEKGVAAVGENETGML